jgi:3-oxoadipate enol-lactonase
MTSTDIHVHEAGSGPAVLLLHGAPTTTRGFAPMIARLATSHRVLVPDLPGYGASRALDGKYTLERVREQIEDALLARGVREVGIVGHSAGAYRGFSIALAGRVCVDRIVSLSGVAGYGDDVRAAFRQLAGMIRAGVDFRPAWLQRMTGPDFVERHPEDVADVMSWLTAASSAVLAAEMEAFADAEDLRPRLRELDAQVLARVGLVDQASPVSFSRDIVSCAQSATLQVVPGCGHAIFYEDAVGTLEAVATFLDA